MGPTIVVLLLLALGVGIIAWHVRRTPSRPYEQRRDQDTAWNDPLTPADATPAADPFAQAPFEGAPTPEGDRR